METYRNREVVTAYQVGEPGESVNTRNGLLWAPSGSWVVFAALGVVIVADKEFADRYAVWDDSVPVALEPSTDVEFTPLGKTVDDVVEFMDQNPYDVRRIQAIEGATANPRKGIMNYA